MRQTPVGISKVEFCVETNRLAQTECALFLNPKPQSVVDTITARATTVGKPLSLGSDLYIQVLCRYQNT